MNLLERLSMFNTQVKKRYKIFSENFNEDYYIKYIRSNDRYSGAVAYDFNKSKDYITFYFEEFKNETEKQEYIKNCIYRCLIN